MKICPYCKKTITEDNDTCPHCGRVLVERVHTTQSTTIKLKKINPLTIMIKNFPKKLIYKLKRFDFAQLIKYIFIFGLISLILYFVLSNNPSKVNSPPVSIIPLDEASYIDPTETPVVPTKDPKLYISLSNGKILFKLSKNFNGGGQLKITNGTKYDAVAKLVNTLSNKSILTVYIKANSVYEVTKISDGDYKLFFNLGNDWDTNIRAFTVNSSYEVFDENFNFLTTEYERSTEYTTYDVTLNPVIDGNARTNDIEAVEFGNL